MTQAWEILTISVPVEMGEDVADWIREAMEIEPVHIERPHSPLAWIELYFATDTEAMLAQRVLQRQYPAFAYSLRGCQARDWQEFWKTHFHAHAIGKRLQIVPVWEVPPDNGRITLLLDPGLSFGTGEHFTTRFCLEQIDRVFETRPPANMLDAGTGSGILAIAAEKLGCPAIEAFDFDPLCLEHTRKNLELNGARQIHLFEHDLTRGIPGGPYELVCANVFSRLLIQCAPELAKACSGTLVITGILQHESDDVAGAFLQTGGREVLWDGDGEWCGMVFDYTRSGPKG